MFKGKAYIIFDGQAGSCGKGKFVGTLARQMNFDISINNNTPNAGHTFTFDNGEKVITTHLPIAVVNPNIKYLMIGAGAAIDPEILNAELTKYSHLLSDRKLFIHERAAIVLEKHKSIEQATIKSGSTFKGSGAALVDKMLRKPDVILAKDYNWTNNIKIVDDNFIASVLNGKNGFTGKEQILIETSQGFDLDINHGLSYPYVTSRGCTPNQALEYCGLPNNIDTEIYMIFRRYPIRISNSSIIGEIYCGDYAEAKEISWPEVKKCCFSKEDLVPKEQTTVTKKTRRVFEFSDSRFYQAVTLTNPNYLILNFAQYIDYSLKDMNNTSLQSAYFIFTKCNELNNISDEEYCNAAQKIKAFAELCEFIAEIEAKFSKKILLVGTGENESSYINFAKVSEELKQEYLDIQTPGISHNYLDLYTPPSNSY